MPLPLNRSVLSFVVHLLILGKAGAGNVLQRVFLAAIDGEVVVTALAGVNELDVDVFADALQGNGSATPQMEKWKSRRRLLPSGAHTCRPRGGSRCCPAGPT